MVITPARLACVLVLLVACLFSHPAFANDKAKLFATSESGYARLILDFPTRLDLPQYKIRSDNGVLAIEFDNPIDISLPDVAAALPNYITIARVDPDGRGLRFGLRATLTINHMEAGEQLFIDLMPSNWQGLPPGLPPQVVANLSKRAREAAIRAEQQRKAEEAKTIRPAAQVRIGRNPTFMRLQFDWNVDTQGQFALNGTTGNLQFDWPVPVDLSMLKAQLPPELVDIENVVNAAGSEIVLHAAKGVVPRFYKLSNRSYVVDIDIASTVPASYNPQQDATAKALAKADMAVKQEAQAKPHGQGDGAMAVGPPIGPITPIVDNVDGTVRITFPFPQDTAAAVFRRGNTLWMLFDTLQGINQPGFSQDLAALAKSFTVTPAGATQVVRIDLSTDKLATLGSAGRSWVLSLGDNLLTPTEPLTLKRRQDSDGLYQITADLDRPAKVHQFRDPVVGDTLSVVTAFPPARGATRTFSFVDFEALRSVHGLVIKPEHDDVKVGIDQKLAVISSPEGLVVSPPDPSRNLVAEDGHVSRATFIDLGSLKQDDPLKFAARTQAMMATAAQTEGAARDRARLDLARYYVANRFAYESIGVLDVLDKDLKTPDLKNDVQLTLGIADTLAHRPTAAVKIFDTDPFSGQVDVALWRSMAKAENYDYRGASTDAQAAVGVIDNYPNWVRTRFLLSAIRAGLETNDIALAERLLKKIDFATLDPEQVTDYQLLTGRVAEAENHYDEALDSYGQVIAADIRPTRAEAVYRTILILNETGRIDLPKATKTLAAETLLWRGGQLEVRMDKLLAELYFRNHQYRLGFQTVKQTVQFFHETPDTTAMATEAQSEFADLYLNGKADSLEPVEALSLYYDFRNLTPPGAKGDAMIRNLAQRLVKVDLLGQAASLLQYQVKDRLTGAARAQIATELAVIQIANHNPSEALKVLNSTEMANLPPALDRQRRVLEARALIDAKRYALALDMLTPVTGRDADKLRVEAYWDNKTYDRAGEAIELIYDQNGQINLDSRSARLDVVKAGVAFALAGDQIGLSRVRSKFSDAMAKTAEWPMFDYVTSTIMKPDSSEFKTVARAVADVDSLDSFLASYRQVYGENGGLTPVGGANPAVQAASAAPVTPAATAG